MAFWSSKSDVEAASTSVASVGFVWLCAMNKFGLSREISRMNSDLSIACNVAGVASLVALGASFCRDVSLVAKHSFLIPLGVL